VGVNPYKSLHAAGAPGIAVGDAGYMACCSAQVKDRFGRHLAALEDREKQLMAAAML
jgi:hypothetical protein